MFVCPSYVYHMEQLAEISSKYQTVKPVRTGMYVYALGSQAQATGTAPCRHSTATENDGTRHLSRSRIGDRSFARATPTEHGQVKGKLLK